MIEAEGTARYAYKDGTWFITLTGEARYALGPALNALVDRALAQPGEQRFVVDLSHADGIDSTCLGVLARLVSKSYDSKAQRPVIITGGDDMNELLLVVCFDRLFDLVESVDSPHRKLQPIPAVKLDQEDMLSLLLKAHKNLCAIDANTNEVFKDVVEALEAEVMNDKERQLLA